MKNIFQHFAPKAHNESNIIPLTKFDKNLLGGKGANLFNMCEMGMPIPPGFTITTELCTYYYNNNKKLPEDFDANLRIAIKQLEEYTGKTFGGGNKPLLVSIRSGAAESMPGMMDTVLNLGINNITVNKLAENTSNIKFALDTYRRFIEIYADIVLEVPFYKFNQYLSNFKEKRSLINDYDLSETQLREIIDEYLSIVNQTTSKEFNQDPFQQLKDSIIAVLNSWMSERAITYRRINNIPGNGGTAINIQAMVFGNMGNDSATGVLFTRNPSNGQNHLFGEFMINAQGEDVVAGIRTPSPITFSTEDDDHSMQVLMPSSFKELNTYAKRLEHYFKDMQDIEFTIEQGKLYLLQTRAAKRTTKAAINIAYDMVHEGIISREDAINYIKPESLNQLIHPSLENIEGKHILAKGLPASPGAASGIAVFNAHDAEQLSHHHKVILVRNDTSPEDIAGMHAALGILTARGGMTSHAAVVARGMGRPCVCALSKVKINEHEKFLLTDDGHKISQGDEITIDGEKGIVIKGSAELTPPDFPPKLNEIISWGRIRNTMHVRVNAETVDDLKVANKFNAEGIGLCRTEHMFFDKNKLPLIRQMIIANKNTQKQDAIEKLLPMQIKDFRELFKLIGNHPINIRLLDPPLHEFLPREASDIKSIAEMMQISVGILESRLHKLSELNPMLGHRGCRLGISNPEIYEMQIKAIFEAAKEHINELNTNIMLDIMVPLVSSENEIKIIRELITQEFVKLPNNIQEHINLKIGTMIELPRACFIADKIAPMVDYFSFGTNDLTQTTFGISRDDASSFMQTYIEEGIYNHDPFVKIDQVAVGALIEIAITKGKAANPNLIIGVCGEHAGDPESIRYFKKIGVDYISCSPYRVPIAKVAAYQTFIK